MVKKSKVPWHSIFFKDICSKVFWPLLSHSLTWSLLRQVRSMFHQSRTCKKSCFFITHGDSNIVFHVSHRISLWLWRWSQWEGLRVGRGWSPWAQTAIFKCKPASEPSFSSFQQLSLLTWLTAYFSLVFLKKSSYYVYYNQLWIGYRKWGNKRMTERWMMINNKWINK